MVLALVIGVTITMVQAWNGPSANPPTGSGAIATDSSNNVGIGDTTPSYKLDVAGDIRSTGKIYANANNQSYFCGGDDACIYDANVANTANIRGVQNSAVGALQLGSNTAAYLYGTGANIGIGTTSAGYKLTVSGDVQATGFYYSSDLTLKTDITPLRGGLSDIMRLNGVRFAWKESNMQDVGLIAQEVEKIFPEFVVTDSLTGLKSVDYAKLTVPLIAALQEQQEEINDLREEVEALRSND